jgi:hypothetical protein
MNNRPIRVTAEAREKNVEHQESKPEKPRFLSMPDRVFTGEAINDAIAVVQRQMRAGQPEGHRSDDTYSCAWCAEFICCMNPETMRFSENDLFCNEECGSKYLDYLQNNE